MPLDAWPTETYAEWKPSGPYVGQRNSRAVLRLGKQFLRRTVLDAGCGDGAMIQALREFHPHVWAVGIDLAPAAVRNAVGGSLAQLPFRSGSFDCVLMMDVLEHLPVELTNPILREFARVLKAGGTLCVTLPNAEDLNKAVVQCPHCGKSFHPVGHTQSFSAGDLRRTLAEAGFRDVQIRSYGLDAYYHFGAAARLISAVGRVVFPLMRWDEWLFASARPGVAEPTGH